MKKFHTNGGISILGLIILAVIVIFVLSYMGISIKSVAESPTGQENFGFARGVVQGFYNAYLGGPLHYLWNDVWIKIFWRGFISNMERIRDGMPTDFDKAADSLKIGSF